MKNDYSVVSLRNGTLNSSNVSAFAEKSWANLSNISDELIEQRPVKRVTAINISNTSINTSKHNTSDQENVSYHIEEVGSDNDESKKKSVHILSRSKRKLNSSDGNSSKKRSLNKSSQSPVRSLSQRISTPESPIITSVVKLKKHVVKTPVNLDRSEKLSSAVKYVDPLQTPVKLKHSKQQISTPESPINPSVIKIKKHQVRTPIDLERSKRFTSANKHDDSFKTPTKSKPSEQQAIENELTPINSQTISEVQSPVSSSVVNLKKQVVRTPINLSIEMSKRFSSTNNKQDDSFKTPTKNKPLQQRAIENELTPIKSQIISEVESPVRSSVVKIKKHVIKTPGCLDRSKHPIMSKYDDSFRTPIKRNQSRQQDMKNELTPIKSQIITEVQSPNKGRPGAIQSRCFLRLSKKVEKQVRQYNLAKMNASKSSSQQQPTFIKILLEAIHLKREERGNWLSLVKNDKERSSLFLRLTSVGSANNGFVNCDCDLVLEKMTEVITFKYETMKTLIPTHYANEFELSSQAIVEYVGPWCVHDDDELEISFVVNPFWIHILDHGSNDVGEDEYEAVYNNPNLDDSF